MSYIVSEQTHYKEAGETRNILVSFADVLDHDHSINERLSAVSSVSASPSGPTLSGSAVTTVPRIINGVEVPAGKAISFVAAAGTNGVTYTITCTVTTSGSQTIVRKLTLIVQAT